MLVFLRHPAGTFFLTMQIVRALLGYALMTQLRASFLTRFSEPILLVTMRSIPDERLLYVPDTTVLPSEQTVNSVLQEKCDPTNETLDMVPALLLDSDLHTTFPKPYTLDLN